MDENESSIHSLIVRYLVAHTQCSGCGQRYTSRDVRIHDHRGDVWLASVTCRNCGLQGLVMAAIATRDAEQLQPVDDSEVEEVAGLEMGPISGEEILDFHCFVEQFDGDMHQLLERRKYNS